MRIRRARVRCSCHWSRAVSVPEPSTNIDEGKLEVTGILLHPDIESGSEGVSDGRGFLALDQDVAAGGDVFAGHACLEATADRHHVLDLQHPLRDLSDVLRHKPDSGGCICRRLSRLFTCYLVMIGRVCGRLRGRVSGFLLPFHVLILQVIQPRYDGPVLGSFCGYCFLSTQCVKAVPDRLPVASVAVCKSAFRQDQLAPTQNSLSLAPPDDARLPVRLQEHEDCDGKLTPRKGSHPAL